MKRLALGLTLLATPAFGAVGDIDDTPPTVRPGSDIGAAVRLMGDHGWEVSAGRCLNAFPNVCEVEFKNICGVVYRATVADDTVTAFKFVKIQHRTSRPGGILPPCPKR